MSSIRTIPTASTAFKSDHPELVQSPSQPFWNKICPLNATSLSASVSLSPTDLRRTAHSSPLFPPSGTASNEELLRNIGQIIHNCKIASENPVVTDWKAETDKALGDFIKKASMFSALTMMDAKLSSSLSSEIIREACKTNRSILGLYLAIKGNELTLWNKLSARLIYFVYYHCGIIPNTVKATAKALLEKARQELILKDGGKNLTALISLALSHADTFLADYLKALKEYSEWKGEGSRDDYLAKKLQLPIGKICEEFSETAVRDLLPEKIPFFQSWKKSEHLGIRILAKATTYPIEWYLNRRLKIELKKQIPSWVQSLIEPKKEDAQEKDLPFSVSITQGILNQLCKFKTQINKSGSIPAESSGPIPGTKKLPQVVSQLLKILKLEPYKTQIDLENNFNKINGSKSSSDEYFPLEWLKNTLLAPSKKISDMVAESLQTSIVDGCHTFFSYIADPKNSEEFFYEILSLSNATFTDKAPSDPDQWRKLGETYAALKNEMRHEAGELFQIVIRQSVSNRLHGLSDADMQQIAAAFCLSQRDGLTRTTDLLNTDFVAMRKKLQNRSTDKSLLKNLDGFLSTIEVHRIQTLIKNRSQLSPEFCRGIDQKLNPAYRYLNSLAYKAAKARDCQKVLTSNSNIAKELYTIQKLLQQFSLKSAASELPRIMPTYQSALEQIRLEQKEKADTLAARLEEQLHYLNKIHQEFQAQELIVRNLSALWQKDGPLNQIAKETEKRIKGEKSAFQWTKAHRQIEILSSSLTSAKREHLYSFIEALEKSQTLEESQNCAIALKEEITSLYRSSSQECKISAETFIKGQQEAEKWIQETLESMENSSHKANETLLASVQHIETNLENLKAVIPTIQPERTETFDAKIVRSLGGASSLAVGSATAALGIGLTYWMGPSATPLLGAATGALYSWKNNSSSKKIGSALFKGTLAGAAAGAVVASNSAVGPYIAPALLSATAIGEKTQKAAISTISDDYVYPKVMEIFDNMYDFVLQRHVWKWAVSDSINMINATYRT